MAHPVSAAGFTKLILSLHEDVCSGTRQLSTLRAGKIGRLFFAKCSLDLVAHRLHEIRQDIAITRLDEGLDRHARHEFDVAEPGDLLSG